MSDELKPSEWSNPPIEEALNAYIDKLEKELAEANRLKDFFAEQIDELGNHLMLNHQSDFGKNREKPLGEGACEMAIRLLSEARKGSLEQRVADMLCLRHSREECEKVLRHNFPDIDTAPAVQVYVGLGGHYLPAGIAKELIQQGVEGE